MSHYRFSTYRSDYHRGGLVFTEGPARRMAGGKLVIFADARTFDRDALRELVRDPNVAVDVVGSDGLTEAEREVLAPASPKPSPPRRTPRK